MGLWSGSVIDGWIDVNEKKRARNGKELWSEGDVAVGSVYPLLLDVNSYMFVKLFYAESYCLVTSSSC
jgi:hypothetical protein